MNVFAYLGLVLLPLLLGAFSLYITARTRGFQRGRSALGLIVCVALAAFDATVAIPHLSASKQSTLPMTVKKELDTGKGPGHIVQYLVTYRRRTYFVSIETVQADPHSIPKYALYVQPFPPKSVSAGRRNGSKVVTYPSLASAFEQAKAAIRRGDIN